MSAVLFRSLGAFGAKGKLLLITVVTLLFSFFLIIPSTSLTSITSPVSMTACVLMG